MLAPYLRKIDTAAMLLPYLRKADTSAMLANYVRTNDSRLDPAGLSICIRNRQHSHRYRCQIDSRGFIATSFKTDGINGDGTITGNLLTTDRGYSLPDADGTFALSVNGIPADDEGNVRVPLAPASDYIQNQDAIIQNAKFKISGTGLATRFRANRKDDGDTPDAAFVSAGNIGVDGINGSGHSFRAQDTFRRPGFAYNAFDAAIRFDSLGNADHIADWQSRSKFARSATDTLNKFVALHTEHVTEGYVKEYSALHINGLFSQTGTGTANLVYGLHVKRFNHIGNKQWAIRTEGQMKSSLGGTVNVGIVPDSTRQYGS